MKTIFTLLHLFSSPAIDWNGKWTGFYSYGKRYPIKLQNAPVIFDMIIQENGNQIKGTIKEDESNGISEQTEFSGSVKKGKIRFVKTYKNHYTVDENGHYVTENETYEVHYSGYYNSFQKKLTGNWKIYNEIVAENGKTYTFVSKGKWEVSKKH